MPACRVCAPVSASEAPTPQNAHDVAAGDPENPTLHMPTHICRILDGVKHEGDGVGDGEEGAAQVVGGGAQPRPGFLAL